MKRLLLSALCAVPAFCIGQTLLYNDGAIIKVQNGATLYVEGGIHNTSTGTIDNDGTIEVKGNFLNQGNWEASNPNTLKFTGNVTSDLTPGTAVFHDVVVQKDNNFNVNLLGHMTVINDLNFNATGSSKIITNNFDVKIGDTCTITGPDANEYVATTGTGMMQKAVSANNTFAFPVGDLTIYSPLSSTYTGSGYAAATIRVKANDAIHPNKPADATDYLSRFWDVNASGITGYNNLLTGTYDPSTDLVGTASLVKGAVYDGAEWSYFDAAAGSNTVIGSTGDATADFTGTNFFGKVNLVAFLQGAYNASTGLMSTTYTNNATIEALMLNSPYTDAPATVADVPTDVTDWVKLELRDPGNPATVFGKTSAFVKKDGKIVGLDGTSIPLIKNGNPTSIVAVVHRTHLSIRTPNAGINVTDGIEYNFSTDTLQAYRNTSNNFNPNMKFVTGTHSKYTLWAANGNSNTNSRFSGSANDRDYLLNTILGGNPTTILTNVYSTGDYNMNGIVRFSGSANDRDYLLNSVLGGNPTKIITQHF